MWFNILKVDIDFKPLPKTQLGEYDPNTDEIGIDEKNVYEYLKSKGKTTDEEIIDYIVRVVNHETAHAAHEKTDDQFYERFESQQEYIAYALENIADPIHLRLVNFVNQSGISDTARGKKIMRILQEAADQDRMPPEEYVKTMLRINRFSTMKRN